MITLKDIFGTLAVVFIVFGCITAYNGLSIGDTLIKFGLAILLLIFLIRMIHIPQNSKGTSIEKGMINGKLKSTRSH